MVSDCGGSEEAGKKRKTAAEAVAATAAMRREPRRGLGVAELERIRVALEVAERCYAVPPLSAAQPPALPRTALVVHGATLSSVGIGALQLQMPRGYFTPYYVAAQQHESLTRLFRSNVHGHPPSSHQNNSGRQADQIQSAVTALPATGQAASSEAAYQQRQSRRRGQPRRQQKQPAQTAAVPAAHQVAFVDLVDSDDEDDNGGNVEELDLELRL